MAQCPFCQHEITEDFGLVTCEGCGRSVFVDMDGGVSATEDDASDLYEAPSEGKNFEPLQDEYLNLEEPSTDYAGEGVYAEEPEESFHSVEEQEISSFESEENEMGISAELSAEDPDQSYVEFSDDSEESDFLEELEEDHAGSNSLDRESVSSEFAAPTKEPKFTDREPSVKDIAEYGNSELASAEQGSVFYNLRIEGLDSEQVRSDFVEAIDDKKLMLNVDDIISQIKDGSVLIRDISALKASVILNSVSNLPIKISWEQYLIMGQELAEEPFNSEGGEPSEDLESEY